MGEGIYDRATDGGTWWTNPYGKIAKKAFGDDPLGLQNNYQATGVYSPGYIFGMVDRQGRNEVGQMELVNALRAQMQGQAPNPSQTQYLQNMQGNVANAQGMIASQRGLNPALAARMGTNAATAANNQSALGAALLQQQQQLGAQQQLGGMYGQLQQGNLGYQDLYGRSAMGAQGINAHTAEGNVGRNAQMIGGGMNAIGSIFGSMAGGMSKGGVVPGNEMVPGDSPKNDTVPVMLSPGEIVVKKSMAHDPEKAKEFIDHLLKDKGKKKGADYGDVLKARRKAA